MSSLSDTITKLNKKLDEQSLAKVNKNKLDIFNEKIQNIPVKSNDDFVQIQIKPLTSDSSIQTVKILAYMKNVGCQVDLNTEDKKELLQLRKQEIEYANK
jgi:hypothetical protein